MVNLPIHECPNCRHTQRCKTDFPRCSKCGKEIRTPAYEAANMAVGASRRAMYMFYGWKWKSVEDVWGKER